MSVCTVPVPPTQRVMPSTVAGMAAVRRGLGMAGFSLFGQVSQGSVRMMGWIWAIIRCLHNLKFFFAGIPQGPLETSPGTIKKFQKRFQGPPARGF